jgi:hypothetical protein
LAKNESNRLGKWCQGHKRNRPTLGTQAIWVFCCSDSCESSQPKKLQALPTERLFTTCDLRHRFISSFSGAEILESAYFGLIIVQVSLNIFKVSLNIFKALITIYIVETEKKSQHRDDIRCLAPRTFTTSLCHFRSFSTLIGDLKPGSSHIRRRGCKPPHGERISRIALGCPSTHLLSSRGPRPRSHCASMH